MSLSSFLVVGLPIHSGACSCLPNAVLIFEGKSSVVRAVEHIPEGAEVRCAFY